jgi:hypothetical protein
MPGIRIPTTWTGPVSGSEAAPLAIVHGIRDEIHACNTGRLVCLPAEHLNHPRTTLVPPF